MSPPVSPALSAFLRGIERRAFVFAQVQCGDDDAAEQALERAMRAFRDLSVHSPLSAWPASFWAILMAQGELSAGTSEIPELVALASGPRAALLLRIVAGLDFPHAAQVLGVSERTYRFALQRALQQLGDAGVSYAALGALRERLHRQVKTLPLPRTESLAALRARAMQALPEPVPAAPAATSPWPRRLLWTVLALLALAFAATFWTPAPSLEPGGTERLPSEPAPVPVPAGSATDVVTHPDFASLAAPGDEAVAEDLALLSWLASGQSPLTPEERAAPVAPLAPATPPGPAAATASAPAAALPPGQTAAPAPSTSPASAGAGGPAGGFQDLRSAERQLLAPLASAWPALDPDTRQRLQANAAHWSQLDAAGRAQLQGRISAWDDLPPAERARRRGALAAWQELSDDEKAQVRAAAATLAALPPARRQALREAFDALPSDRRQDWWLGPTLGDGFAELRPLFAFVPGDERTRLLALLRELGPEARADLGLLARRLPANERESLRRELMAAAASERAALLRARLGQ